MACELASRARRRVREAAPPPDPDLTRQRAVVDAYFAAAREGDMDALVAVLETDVVLRAHRRDGDPLELKGAARVARGAMTARRFAPYVPAGAGQRRRRRGRVRRRAAVRGAGVHDHRRRHAAVALKNDPVAMLGHHRNHRLSGSDELGALETREKLRERFGDKRGLARCQASGDPRRRGKARVRACARRPSIRRPERYAYRIVRIPNDHRDALMEDALPAVVICDGKTKGRESVSASCWRERSSVLAHAPETPGVALEASQAGAEKRDECAARRACAGRC